MRTCPSRTSTVVAVHRRSDLEEPEEHTSGLAAGTPALVPFDCYPWDTPSDRSDVVAVDLVTEVAEHCFEVASDCSFRWAVQHLWD